MHKKLFRLVIFFSLLLIAYLSYAAEPIAVSKSHLITLNFQDIKTRTLLQLLADFSGFNIIVSNTVQGGMSLHLQNTPWEQALDVVLQSQGLGKRIVGNVIIVAPLSEINAQEKQALQEQQQMAALVPLQAELIPIKYGKASALANLLKDNSLLSLRGSVSVDERTNSLWIQEQADKLANIHHLLSQLDVPVKEVMIEARIVNLDNNYENELGIRFGVNGGHVAGTLDGANAAVTGTATGDIPINQRLNIDLPAVNVANAGGASSVGLALAHLTKGIMLDLELSALESEGAAQIISNPHLITADQQAASIEAGEEIPYQESTSSGATNVAFKKAVLSLNVTPQITPDGKVVLTLKVSQDKPSSREIKGVPAIDTRQIETQVLVDNEQTIVLGGIYEQKHLTQSDRVPFFSALPVVGHLFQHDKISQRKTELLIFVTPRILSQT